MMPATDKSICYGSNRLLQLLLLLASTWFHGLSVADEATARANMENPGNSLMLMQTSQGDIYMELFAGEAPATVRNFIALAEAEMELQHPDYDIKTKPHFYDGQTFHRVIPGFLIQTGSPRNQRKGIIDYQLADEINAQHLGLDKIPLFDEAGSLHPWLNLEDRQGFHDSILLPLYEKLGITSKQELAQPQFAVLAELKQMSLMQAYENFGYRYNNRYPSRSPSRGTLAMATSGPNTGNSEFFIVVTDSNWLAGKNTVFGQVVEGIDIVERINSYAVNPGSSSPPGTVIYTMRLVP